MHLKFSQLSIETFLIEANERGSKQGLHVYVHAVGLGLGVWMFKPQVQNEIYLQAFQNVLEQVDLPHISDLDFSWIERPKSGIWNSHLNKQETQVQLVDFHKPVHFHTK